MKRATLSAALLAAGACAPPAPTDAGIVIEHPLPFAHSHNDETRAEPLAQALGLRFASIEVDVIFYEGELLAGHDLFTIAGGFEALYLEPLQARVDARGSVYGDGAPLLLWIDLKSDDAVVRDAVHEALARYGMLSRFTDDGVEQRAVTAILTGSEVSKAAYAGEHDVRYACRDSNVLAEDDPVADAVTDFRYYALDFRAFVDAEWNGSDDDSASEGGAEVGGDAGVRDAPAAVQQALADVVARARTKGRPLRLWGAPDTPASWRAQRAAGVDFIGADDLAALAAALADAPPPTLAASGGVP